LEAGVGGVNGGGWGGLWKFKVEFRFSFLGESEDGGVKESWNNNPSFSFFAVVKEGSCCAVLRRFKRTHDIHENTRTAERRNKYVKWEKLCFVSSERTGISTTLSLWVENGWPGDILERGDGRGTGGNEGLCTFF
jgi:hypothetical protein